MGKYKILKIYDSPGTFNRKFKKQIQHPEFYAAYKLMNVKNHNVYSDNFILRVVDLNQIELATGEDKQYEIDYWASLFKAKTWEELKMIAQNNEFMQEATETLYELNADNIIRQQCLARQDYYQTQNAYKKRQEELEKAYREITEEKEALLVERDVWLAEKEAILAEIDVWSTEKDALQLQFSDKDRQINDKDQKILELQAQLEHYKN